MMLYRLIPEEAFSSMNEASLPGSRSAIDAISASSFSTRAVSFEVRALPSVDSAGMVHFNSTFISSPTDFAEAAVTGLAIVAISSIVTELTVTVVIL